MNGFMLRLFHKRIPVVLAAFVGLAVAACMAGCSRGDIDDGASGNGTTGEKPAEVAYIRLRMNLHGSGIPQGTRAEGSVADRLPGSANENRIDKLDLLVFDANFDLLRQVVPIETAQLQHVGDNVYEVSASVLALREQRLHIYAVANLPDNMRRRLTPGLGSECNFVWTQSDYRALMNDLMPGSDGKQERLKSTGIPMTGQLKTETGGVDIIFSKAHTSEATALRVSTDLCRMVAKVHVTAATESYTLSDGEQVDYVKAVDTHAATPTPVDPNVSSDQQWIGWIRLSNVRYILNGTNKSTFLFPQTTGSTGEYPLYRDCNMDLDSYVVGDGFDGTMWERDYNFLRRAQLHETNIEKSDLMARVETYDATRLSQNTTNPYFKGMYCLENYFDRPQLNTEVFDRYEGKSSTDVMPGENANVIPMVTHVYVAAKLTPRYVLVAKDFLKMMDDFVQRFDNTPEQIRKDYGLNEEDFTKEGDVARWKALKERDATAAAPQFTGEGSLFREAFRIIKTQTEQEAADLIKWSLIGNNRWGGANASGIENDKCPPGTFYVYDTYFDSMHIIESQWDQRYLYLTAGAVAAAEGNNMRIKVYSVPHLGGWGYYYTYLDQTGEKYYDRDNTLVEGRAPFTASQVTRNTYYVLTVSNFGGPGGTITSPEFIRVNTEPVGWDYDGRGDIDLF